MRAHDRRIIHSSVESDYRTQPRLFEALDQEFDFTVDMAASRRSRLCERWYGPDHPDPDFRDALDPKEPWYPGRRFLNPPYSVKLRDKLREQGKPEEVWRAMEIKRWVERCWLETRYAGTVVAIVPYSPQTEWWRQFISQGMPVDVTLGDGPRDSRHPWHRAHEIRQFYRRLSFLTPEGKPTGGAGVNHAVVVWKPNPGYVEPWTPVVRYWEYE